MKKIIYTSLLVTLVSLTGMAQAVLPTSWNFANATLPNGWVASSGVDYYTGSGNPQPAIKFDADGENLTINFASSPGVLTYDAAGNTFTAGVFTVEQSDLGTVWTPLRTFSNTVPGSTGGSYASFSDTPLSTTRYIRFMFTDKQTGNIGIDNVSIAVGAATPAQEINVKQGTTTIVTGGTYSFNSAVSTMTPLTFTVENLGTATALNVASATISGPAAADYSVATTTPFTVNAASNTALTVNFTPSVAGTRTAVLTIVSDDADENPYIINLDGIGGAMASEPAAQATALNFTNVKTYRFTGAFTPAAGVDGYIVVRKTGSAITADPVDGQTYDRGDNMGDAKVVFSGTSTSFSPNDIVAGTQYFFKVYTYNGAGAYRNYRTTAPLAATVTTPATMMPAGYYSGITMTNAATFVSQLHTLTNTHNMQYYSNYGNLMIAKFAARDTVDNQRVITCVYSGENKIYTEPFDFTTNNFSREHTYAHSWMPTNPAQSLPEYNDYHHLFPTNQNQANAVRSNYPLGIVATQTSSYLGAKYGYDVNGHLVYEPRDAHKGDAARAMMYEAIAYTTVGGHNWGFPNPIGGGINYGQDQFILKQWHFQDPPSNYEIARNDYVDSLQHNRNPFVDNVDYPCFINFSNMTYYPDGCTALEMTELLSSAFITYPNPAKTELNLHVDATTISAYEVIDMQGRTVLSGTASDLVLVKLNVASLKSGSYIVKATTPYGTAQKQFVIE